MYQNTKELHELKIISDNVNKYLISHNLVQVADVYEKRQRFQCLRNDAIMREIAPNEIVIEFDTDTRIRGFMCAKRTMKRLIANGYNFVAYDHQSRSPHIHVYDICGLECQDDEIRRRYKKLFIRKYADFPEVDYSLTGSHLIASENKPHFKHKHIKKMMFVNTDKELSISNKLDIDILINAQKWYIRDFTRPQVEEDLTDYTWLLKWLGNTKLEKGGIDLKIWKNIAILITTQDLETHEFFQQVQNTYGFDAVSQIRGWIRWSLNRSRKFQYREIEEYCKKHNINLTEVQTKWKQAG